MKYAAVPAGVRERDRIFSENRKKGWRDDHEDSEGYSDRGNGRCKAHHR